MFGTARLSSIKWVLNCCKSPVPSADCPRLLKVNRPSLLCTLRSINNMRHLRTELISEESLHKFRLKDKISNDYKIIYKTGSEKYITMGKYYSTIALGLFVILISVYCIYELPKGNFTIEYANKPLATSIVEPTIFFAAYLAMNIGIYKMCRKLPLRIYHSDEKNLYKAIFVGKLPTQTKLVTFKPKEPKPGNQTKSFLPWRRHRFILKGKEIYLVNHDFRCPNDFYKLIGYIPKIEED